MKDIKTKIDEIKAKYGVSPNDKWIDGMTAVKILNEIAESEEIDLEDEEEKD